MSRCARHAWWFASAVLLGLVVGGCQDDAATPPVERHFAVAIDSVQVPQVVTLGDTIRARLYGVVGYTGCYSYAGAEVERQGHDVYIEARGRLYVPPSGLCYQAFVYMRGEPVEVCPADAGTYRLYFRHGEAEDLERVVEVRPAP
ncbi:MAG: hypothetical protein ACYDIE_01870 [Candidatus Krumholzibacteriia bacterium]